LWRALSARQWSGWETFWQEEPWGDVRADAREEASQIRLLRRAFGGESGEAVSATWPYFGEGVSAEEMVAAGRATDENLVPKEGGGYEWRRPLPS
jgi:hypothetical protein